MAWNTYFYYLQFLWFRVQAWLYWVLCPRFFPGCNPGVTNWGLLKGLMEKSTPNLPQWLARITLHIALWLSPRFLTSYQQRPWLSPKAVHSSMTNGKCSQYGHLPLAGKSLCLQEGFSSSIMDFHLIKSGPARINSFFTNSKATDLEKKKSNWFGTQLQLKSPSPLSYNITQSQEWSFIIFTMSCNH